MNHVNEQGYIAFVDSDDYLDLNMYQELVALAREHDADIVECGFRWVKPWYTVDKNNTDEIHIYTGKEACEQLYFHDVLYQGLAIMPWNKLYRRELLKDIRYPNLTVCEDSATTPRLLYKSKKVVKIDRNLYNFYFSENSLSRSEWSVKYLDSIEANLFVGNFFKEHDEMELYKFVRGLYITALLNGYYNCRLRKKDAEVKERYKQLKVTLKKEKENIRHSVSSRERIFAYSPTIWFYANRWYKWNKHRKWLKRVKANNKKAG